MSEAHVKPAGREIAIGLVGVLVGAVASTVGGWIMQERQLDYQRSARAFETRLDTYTRFADLSLTLYSDFQVGSGYDPEDARELNATNSRLMLVASDDVQAAATDVRSVIAKLRKASPAEREAILEHGELAAARSAFRDAVQHELRLDIP